MADGYISQITLPNGNTYDIRNDTVTQSGNAEDKEYPILLKNTNNTTDETSGVKYSNNVSDTVTVTKPFTYNPSTGILKVSKIQIGIKDDTYGFLPYASNWNSLGANNLYWYRVYATNHYGTTSYITNWTSNNNIGTAATTSAAATLGKVNFYNTCAANGTQTKTTLTADSTANSNITITLPKSTGTLALVGDNSHTHSHLVSLATINSGQTSSNNNFALALKKYFDDNKSTVPRNSLVNFYSSAYGNGSEVFGYYLSNYDNNPYGGFFIAHYDTPRYVGILNGTYTESKLARIDIGNTITSGQIMISDGTDGKIKSSGYTIAKSVPSNAVFTDHYAWSDITSKPTSIALTGAVTATATTLGSGAISIETTVNHGHGYISSTGQITETHQIASGDRLIVTDSANATTADKNKLIATTITFDGSTATKALTQKGTWETFNNYSHPTSAGNKHIPSGGSDGQFLKYGGSSGTATWSALPTASTEAAGIIQIGTGASNAMAGNTNINNVFQDAITYTDYTNWRPLIWGNSNSGTEGFTPGDSTAGVFSAASLTCQPSTGTIRIMNIKLVGAASSSISYTEGTNTKTMISFIKGNANGHAIKIGGGALTVVGGGESAQSISPSATAEHLYLLADNTIYVEANADTLANRIGFAVNTSGAIVPMKAESANDNKQNIGASDNKWANIYATTFTGNLTGNVTGNVSGTASNVTGTVAVANGGTGATTAAEARTNLGLGSIATYGAATAGTKDTWGLVPVIGASDGVMEVGKYIDFHTTDGNTKDYDVRITAATTGLTISGTTSGTFSGTLTGNADTATTATNLSAAPTITQTGTATVNLAANTAYTLTVGGKSVVFKTPADANTNTLVNYTLGNTTRAYLMGSQNAPTSTTTARAAHGDIGVYLTNTAGHLSAKAFSLNDGAASASSVEKAWMIWNSTDNSIDFIFA